VRVALGVKWGRGEAGVLDWGVHPTIILASPRTTWGAKLKWIPREESHSTAMASRWLASKSLLETFWLPFFLDHGLRGLQLDMQTQRPPRAPISTRQLTGRDGNVTFPNLDILTSVAMDFKAPTNLPASHCPHVRDSLPGVSWPYTCQRLHLDRPRVQSSKHRPKHGENVVVLQRCVCASFKTSTSSAG